MVVEATFEYSRQADRHPAEAARTSAAAIGGAPEKPGRAGPFSHLSELHRKWSGRPSRLPDRADRGHPQAADGGALFLDAAAASGRRTDGVHGRGSDRGRRSDYSGWRSDGTPDGQARECPMRVFGEVIAEARRKANL